MHTNHQTWVFLRSLTQSNSNTHAHTQVNKYLSAWQIIRAPAIASTIATNLLTTFNFFGLLWMWSCTKPHVVHRTSNILCMWRFPCLSRLIQSKFSISILTFTNIRVFAPFLTNSILSFTLTFLHCHFFVHFSSKNDVPVRKLWKRNGAYKHK